MIARRNAGLTLVEAALVICFLGVLLSIFVPAFVKHLRTSKVSEAAEQLERLHRGAAAYFAEEHHLEGGVRARGCLPSSAGPFPETPSVDPVEVDFGASTTPGHSTWRALGFGREPEDDEDAEQEPLPRFRYRYRFFAVGEGCARTAPRGQYLVTLQAEGDLDGDGRYSLFERSANRNRRGELVPVEVLFIRDRLE